jgi:cytochrome c556
MRCAVVAALGVAMLVFSDNSAANNFADPTIKDVMQLVNGKNGICKGIGSGLKMEQPKWEDLQAKAKELVPLAKALSKNKPPIGDEESWAKFTTSYAKAAEDLEKAATAKDAKACADAMKVIADCGGCHKAHRVKK